MTTRFMVYVLSMKDKKEPQQVMEMHMAPCGLRPLSPYTVASPCNCSYVAVAVVDGIQVPGQGWLSPRDGTSAFTDKGG